GDRLAERRAVRIAARLWLRYAGRSVLTWILWHERAPVRGVDGGGRNPNRLVRGALLRCPSLLPNAGDPARAAAARRSACRRAPVVRFLSAVRRLVVSAFSVADVAGADAADRSRTRRSGPAV